MSLPEDIPSERILPLNSKPLTALQLTQIAESVELQTKGSPHEILQMIDGKLVELGREPKNVYTNCN